MTAKVTATTLPDEPKHAEKCAIYMAGGLCGCGYYQRLIEYGPTFRKAAYALLQSFNAERLRAEAAEAEVARIRQLALKDPVARMNNICAALEEEKSSSPYSAEAWEQADEDNRQLRQRAVAAEARAEAAEADAKRYRFCESVGVWPVRSQQVTTASKPTWTMIIKQVIYSGDTPTEAIDTAIEQGAQHG